jgi:hypothetical protein
VGFIVASLILLGGAVGKLCLNPFLLSRASGSPHPLYQAESRIIRSFTGVAVGALSGGLLGWLLCLIVPFSVQP